MQSLKGGTLETWRNDFFIGLTLVCVITVWSSVGGHSIALIFALSAGLFLLAYWFPGASFTFVLLNGFAIGGFWPGSAKWLLVLAGFFVVLLGQEVCSALGAS